ncbi:MAG: hypothetical protein R3A52_31660 [Polyangiales bacterium]
MRNIALHDAVLFDHDGAQLRAARVVGRAFGMPRVRARVEGPSGEVEVTVAVNAEEPFAADFTDPDALAFAGIVLGVKVRAVVCDDADPEGVYSSFEDVIGPRA